MMSDESKQNITEVFNRLIELKVIPSDYPPPEGVETVKSSFSSKYNIDDLDELCTRYFGCYS